MEFASFYQAGFECATGYNRHGQWIDQIEATAHEIYADRDYAALAAAGLRTAREGIRWPLVDKPGGYDYKSVMPFIRAADRHGIQIIWDLFHYGYPIDENPFGDSFVARFASYCRGAARFLRARVEPPIFFTPVNEPSYFAWAAGEACLFAPHLCGKAYDLKVQLVRCAIAGINEFLDECPDAVVVHADPICRQVAPRGRDDLTEQLSWFNGKAVFEAYDMLSGRLLPELGGSKAHLGILGINYYWTNQWEIGQPEQALDMRDDRLMRLRDLIQLVYDRYGCDIAITETSHKGAMRARWLRYVAAEAAAAIRNRVPLKGICLYPILGMPEWHDREEWARMGLWDVRSGSRTLDRTLCIPMYEALRASKEQLEPLARSV